MKITVEQYNSLRTEAQTLLDIKYRVGRDLFTENLFCHLLALSHLFTGEFVFVSKRDSDYPTRLQDIKSGKIPTNHK